MIGSLVEIDFSGFSLDAPLEELTTNGQQGILARFAGSGRTPGGSAGVSAVYSAARDLDGAGRHEAVVTSARYLRFITGGGRTARRRRRPRS